MPPNPYVEATLINTLSFIAHSKGGEQALRPFSVSIHGDNAFYVMENEVNAPPAPLYVMQNELTPPQPRPIVLFPSESICNVPPICLVQSRGPIASARFVLS